ncbi:hypothetical protein GO009_06970 [Muricauda sp. TY007]|uniref:DUF6520 family protein n=1 Tax=Allomuricauda sp. TY007 TaxID=2683200 RepID=UPI0013BFC2CE|nr:DUF6520 family protein [Muricauda sp. TY007]NDV15765.1 hypothetical protein [Muricauda sp. TY007]
MKKFKFILPILAFVMAITLAFAVPTEIASNSDSEASELMFVSANDLQCDSCGVAIEPGGGSDCQVSNSGQPCLCSMAPQNAYTDVEEDCTLLRSTKPELP